MRVILAVLSLGIAHAQQSDIGGVISRLQQKWAIALPDFHGSGGSEGFMSEFNSTLREQLADSGVLTVIDRTHYPLNVPQRPEDFKRPSPWLTEWSGPPVGATHLVFGYAGVVDDRMVIFGWLYNLAASDPNSASVFGRKYFGDLTKQGAKDVANQFARDVLEFFGVKTLLGTKIYFVSDRTGHKEIWSMNFDGSNQKQITNFKTITQMPAVSRDAKTLACTTLQEKPHPYHHIVMQSTETNLRAPFASPEASITGWPEFTPDGQRLLFASSASGDTQIYSSNLRGGDLRQLTFSKKTDFSPKVNPKNGADVLFISDRSGKQQLWRMNIDGGDQEMLTSGEGEVANPSWSPDGQFIA